jgi:predicted Holliday junction resolvase-like endonuclease
MKLDPYDIKLILNPVDFLVFNDMNSKDTISYIVFLSRQIDNPNINRLRVQVKSVIEGNNYEWMVVRIDNVDHIEFE